MYFPISYFFSFVFIQLLFKIFIQLELIINSLKSKRFILSNIAPSLCRFVKFLIFLDKCTHHMMNTCDFDISFIVNKYKTRVNFLNIFSIQNENSRRIMFELYSWVTKQICLFVQIKF